MNGRHRTARSAMHATAMASLYGQPSGLLIYGSRVGVWQGA